MRTRPSSGLLMAIILASAALVSPAASAATRNDAPPSSGCGNLAAVQPGSSQTQSLDVGDIRRTFVLHVPTSYEPYDRSPVILAFHGRKSTGAEMEAYSGLSRLDALIVYPDGLADDEGKTGWAGAPYSPEADDLGFVDALLDELDDDYCVDSNRIFATGKSNGGGFTALLACAMPQRIAAFAPVAGAYYPQTSAACHGAFPAPMLEFHGTADTIMEYAGGVSHGEAFPSVPSWLDGWTSRDRCGSVAAEEIGDDVQRIVWTDCVAHTEVVHYRIIGGGHTWPGELVDSGPGSATHTISAAEVMWDFFSRHALVPRS